MSFYISDGKIYYETHNGALSKADVCTCTHCCISSSFPLHICLTHWARVTHICISKLTTTGSDNGLSLDRRQAIISTKAGMLVIGPLGTNFSEIFVAILTFSFKKISLKVLSAKWRSFCLGLNVLTIPTVSSTFFTIPLAPFYKALSHLLIPVASFAQPSTCSLQTAHTCQCIDSTSAETLFFQELDTYKGMWY